MAPGAPPQSGSSAVAVADASVTAGTAQRAPDGPLSKEEARQRQRMAALEKAWASGRGGSKPGHKKPRPYLRTCAECKEQFFSAFQTKQRYCSTRCAGRAKTRQRDARRQVERHVQSGGHGSGRGPYRLLPWQMALLPIIKRAYDTGPGAKPWHEQNAGRAVAVPIDDAMEYLLSDFMRAMPRTYGHETGRAVDRPLLYGGDPMAGITPWEVLLRDLLEFGIRAAIRSYLRTGKMARKQKSALAELLREDMTPPR
jgi:hypothetical protein